MTSKRFNTFETLSTAVKLRDLCEEITDVWDFELPDSHSVAEAFRRVLRKRQNSDLGTPVLLRTTIDVADGFPVFHGHVPYGLFFPKRAFHQAFSLSVGGEVYVDYELLEDEYMDAGGGRCVVEFCEESYVGGETSLLGLLSEQGLSFSVDGALLVLLGTRRYAALTLEDLLSEPRAKACWFALVLDLEKAALEACRHNAIISLASLPEKRLESAVKLREKREAAVGKEKSEHFRHKKIKEALYSAFADPKRDANTIAQDLLDHTMFADKKTMLSAQATRFGFTKGKVRKIFDVAEKMRNWCAHTTSVSELEFDNFQNLKDFCGSVLELISALESYIAGAEVSAVDSE